MCRPSVAVVQCICQSFNKCTKRLAIRPSKKKGRDTHILIFFDYNKCIHQQKWLNCKITWSTIVPSASTSVALNTCAMPGKTCGLLPLASNKCTSTTAGTFLAFGLALGLRSLANTFVIITSLVSIFSFLGSPYATLPQEHEFLQECNSQLMRVPANDCFSRRRFISLYYSLGYWIWILQTNSLLDVLTNLI